MGRFSLNRFQALLSRMAESADDDDDDDDDEEDDTEESSSDMFWLSRVGSKSKTVKGEQ